MIISRCTDGKADLTGCNPGWGCEAVIEHQLTAFKLRDNVTHTQGAYAALMADTIARYRQGHPILYYTWFPYWVGGVLRPGHDVVWLEVPFSSLPGEQAHLDTRLANGNTIFASRGKNSAGPQLIEVTPDKKIVWVLQDWKHIGDATAVQILDDPGTPEIPGQSEH